jgi:hypothetical protein
MVNLVGYSSLPVVEDAAKMKFAGSVMENDFYKAKTKLLALQKRFARSGKCALA